MHGLMAGQVAIRILRLELDSCASETALQGLFAELHVSVSIRLGIQVGGLGKEFRHGGDAQG
jgi:hypothetical protein